MLAYLQPRLLVMRLLSRILLRILLRFFFLIFFAPFLSLLRLRFLHFVVLVLLSFTILLLRNASLSPLLGNKAHFGRCH